MTVSSVNVKDIYVADGVTRDWPITFPVSGLTDTDIKFYTTNADGLSTEITTGLEIDLLTPKVVYPTVASGIAIPSTGGLVISRELPLTQEFIDVEVSGAIPLTSIESALDRVHMILQQQDEKINRLPTADISASTFNPSEYLVSLASAVTAAELAETHAETAETAAEAAQLAAEAARDEAETLVGLTFASQAEAEGATDNTTMMTPLRVKQEVQKAAAVSIPDSNLAQITTASKVHGSALTGLASIVAGAGVIPSANLPAALYGFTRVATGAITTTGVQTSYTMSNSTAGIFIIVGDAGGSYRSIHAYFACMPGAGSTTPTLSEITSGIIGRFDGVQRINVILQGAASSNINVNAVTASTTGMSYSLYYADF